MKGFLIVALAVLELTACTSTTTISSAQPNADIYVKNTVGAAAGRAEKIDVTSFGQYEFMAKNEAGERFYGILPLRFNGDNLTMDVLFFAPAAFFNLREVFPYYQFDIENHTVKYRESEDENWVEYEPTEAERKRAKHWFAKESKRME